MVERVCDLGHINELFIINAEFTDMNLTAAVSQEYVNK
jgi:hypothetical protein